MYKISFYAPESHLEAIKNAMFAAGAGKIGNYSCCAWQTLGQGQFLALEGSHAFVGEINQLETINEYKVEMVCQPDLIQDVIKAMKTAHPYEMPAYQVTNIEDF